MMSIAEKSKVFGSKGVLLSFKRSPDVFLYREPIPGTKKNLYKVIDEAKKQSLGTQSINPQVLKLQSRRIFGDPW